MRYTIDAASGGPGEEKNKQFKLAVNHLQMEDLLLGRPVRTGNMMEMSDEEFIDIDKNMTTGIASVGK